MKKMDLKKVCLYIENRQITHLKKLSHYISLEKSEDIRFSDLVREAIDIAFPMSKLEKYEKIGREK